MENFVKPEFRQNHHHPLFFIHQTLKINAYIPNVYLYSTKRN